MPTEKLYINMSIANFGGKNCGVNTWLNTIIVVLTADGEGNQRTLFCTIVFQSAMAARYGAIQIWNYYAAAATSKNMAFSCGKRKN